MIDFDVGDIIAGRYEIKQVLGAGGMGKVYRARQVDLGRDVALKVPSAAVLESPDIMARFVREAKTVARLLHDNIVQVYEYYHDEEAQLAFIAMEFVEGEDLKNLVSRSPRDVSVGDCALMLQLSCEGIQHAHEAGIVHRDIKPHNIMIARLPRGRWRVKVMDFGIAHIDPAGQFTEMGGGGQLTQTGQALGTPSYMAPEQIRGVGVSHLSDIYSMGCVIYFVFTQQTVFTGSGLTVAVAHLNEAPPSLRGKIPGLPEKFEQVVMHCLEKDPSRRPQDAVELGQSLYDSLAGLYDTPMSEIWKVTSQAPDATIPIIQSTTPSGPEESGDRVVEMGTQQTIGQTGLTDSQEARTPDAAATVVADKVREKALSSAEVAQPVSSEDATLASDAGAKPAPSSIPDATMAGLGTVTEAAEPDKKKPFLLIGGIAVVCLLVGIVGAVVLSGGGKPEPSPIPGDGPNGGVVDATPTPKPIQDPTPTPEGTAVAAGTKTPAAETPTPTPRATKTAVSKTPTPSPTPVDLQKTQLRNLRTAFNNTNSVEEKYRLWGDILGMWTALDPEFSQEVLTNCKVLAEGLVKSPEMVFVSAGYFSMGSSDGADDQVPEHNVYLDAYAIGRYEVTALEYATFLNDIDEPETYFASGDRANVVYDEAMKWYRPVEGREPHPANYVSWEAATRYAEWLTQQTGQKYRLPTEAEWERAAGDSVYPWGTNAPGSNNANFNNPRGTVPVTEMPDGATLLGSIHHLGGNVYEWVYDWYAADYYENSPAQNPRGPELEGGRRDKRVVRGGSFLTEDANELRVSSRYAMTPDEQQADVGFRLARDGSGAN